MNRRIVAFAAAMIALATIGLPPGGPDRALAADVTLTCPAKYDPQQALPAGWWSGRRNEPQRLKQTQGKGRLDGIWIVSGKRGEELAEAPAILVPDRPDGGWDLTAETEGVLLVCLYRGLETYVATDIPTVGGCKWQGGLDRGGFATSPKVACR